MPPATDLVALFVPLEEMASSLALNSAWGHSLQATDEFLIASTPQDEAIWDHVIL